jgi:hypothetical protein
MIQRAAHLSDFCGAIQCAERLTLLEGLPHPTFEPTAFSRELASNAVREILGSPFYKGEHSLTAEDEAAIRFALGDPETFLPCPDEGRFKRCGGFHADFAIEFRHDAGAGAALMCFGCGEVKTLLQTDRWHHDLLPDANAALSRVLLGHRYKRPIPAPPQPPEPRPAEIFRAEAIEAVGTILSDLEAYHRTHGRYPSALSRHQRRRGSPRSVIYYQAKSDGRDFWLMYHDLELDGPIVCRSGSVLSAP